MNKKFLSLVLALVLVLGTFTAVFAAEKTDEVKLTNADAKVQWLIDNKIVEGRKVNENAENNDLALDKNITRAEVTKLIVFALGYDDLAKMLDGAIKAFPDVELNHWANGFISVATTQRASIANNRRIAIGYPDGKFLPENDVTYAELATMLVRIVDKNLTDKMEDNAIWATSYMSWAAEAKLLDGLTIADSDKATNRKDAFVMLYNALFELGKTNYNKVDFGAKIGVISKLQAGKIQLNQDTKQEYKIDWNTVMTGVYDNKVTGWEQLANNASLPGTLARVIVNEEGVVTHIIQLGYDGDAYNKSNWRGVAEEVVQTKNGANNYTYAKFNKDKNNVDKFNTITIDGKELEITNKTKFFVADINKNIFKEVEKLEDVFYYTGKDNIRKVYAGYTEFGKDNKWNEANAIVFGEVQKSAYGNELVRVTHDSNSLYDFYAENTKGEEKVYNFRDTNVFPGTYKADKYDVINLNAYKNNIDELVVIDYSKADIFEVVEVKDRVLKLTDNVKEASFNMRDTEVFTAKNDFNKGAKVQVVFTKDDTEVSVVSIIGRNETVSKGKLPKGIEIGSKELYVVGAPVHDGDSRWSAKLAEYKDAVATKDYYFNINLADKALLDVVGNKVRVTLEIQDNRTFITKVALIEEAKNPVLVELNRLADVSKDKAALFVEKVELYGKAEDNTDAKADLLAELKDLQPKTQLAFEAFNTYRDANVNNVNADELATAQGVAGTAWTAYETALNEVKADLGL